MFWLVVLALLLVSARIAHVYKENILDAVTVSFSALLMIMYVLAFFRGLKGIFAVSALCIVYVLIRTFLDVRKDNSSLGKELSAYGKLIFDPAVIGTLITTAFVGFATRQQVFTWWDDINFWSSDARQLFFMNGFPGKYGNVSPEFGDYPPMTSLTKWLFLQLSPDAYNESLQFLGYYALTLVFLLPMLARIRMAISEYRGKKEIRAALLVLAFVCTVLFPGVFNGIIFYGTPADVVMAIVYGALLLAIYDQYGHAKWFYYTRIGLYTAVLLLSKSIGFEWALFALVFYLVIARREKEMFLSVFGAGACLGSWLLFCFVNRRVAKLTGAGIKMATSGTYSAPDNTMDKMRYFAQGFLFEPMHADHNFNIDLSTAAMVVIIFAAIVIMYNAKILGKNEVKRIALFTLITGIVAYAIVFLAHISIFQGEDQYLDAYAMGVSISRYCAPFTLGSAYLLIGTLFNRLRAKSGHRQLLIACAAFALFAILCADYSGIYKHLWGYRDSIGDNTAYVEDMVGQDGKELVAAVNDRTYWGKRVLVLRDGHEYYWVHNTYISKEASPVALVYDAFLTEEDTPDTIRQKILDSHASYFYVEDKEGAATKLFEDMMPGGGYEPGVVIDVQGAVN